MSNSGSPGFVRYAESFTRLTALQAELDQEIELRRLSFRASINDTPGAKAAENLAHVFAYHRHRVARTTHGS